MALFLPSNFFAFLDQSLINISHRNNNQELTLLTTFSNCRRTSCAYTKCALCIMEKVSSNFSFSSLAPHVHTYQHTTCNRMKVRVYVDMHVLLPGRQCAHTQEKKGRLPDYMYMYTSSACLDCIYNILVHGLQLGSLVGSWLDGWRSCRTKQGARERRTNEKLPSPPSLDSAL